MIASDTATFMGASLSPADLAVHDTRAMADPWYRADHLDLINAGLVAGFEGLIKRLCCFLPTRYGKSMLVSKYLPPWWLGQRPSDKCIISSYAHHLASEHSAYAREVLERQGPQLWGVYPKPGSFAKDDWAIAGHSGGMRAAGVGSGIAGFGADLFILDDAIKDMAEAVSETIQRRNVDWWGTVASKRIEPDGFFVYIQNRWHVKDLAGEMLKLATDRADLHPYIVIRFPEWATEDEFTPVSIVGGKNNVTKELVEWVDHHNANERFHRKKGEVLWSKRWSLPAVKVRYNETPSEEHWQAVSQQKPTDRVGSLFKSDYFQIMDTAPTDALRVRYWDLAATEDAGDYCAGALLSYGPEEDAWYIEDMIRGQWGPGEVEANVKLASQLDGYNVAIRIEQEPGASGKLTVNTFKRMLPQYDIEGCRATGPKTVRHRRMLGPLQRGNMFLLRGPWNQVFITEMINLPGGKHDDQADAAAGAYAELVDLDKGHPSAELI